MFNSDEKSKKLHSTQSTSSKEPRSRIVEDPHYGFWTKPRPWALILLLSLEIANVVFGPAFWFQLGIKYKDAGWTEAARICCRMSNWANPWSREGKAAESYSRVRLPKHDIPRDAQSKNIDGYNLDMAGRTQEAIAVYEQVIREQPNFEWPYNNLANMRIARHEFDEAERLCRKAIQINPDYANGQFTLGTVLLIKGESAEAKVHLQKAKELLRECN